MCQLYIDFLLVCKTEFKVYVPYNTGEVKNSYIGVFRSHLSYKTNKKRKTIFLQKIVQQNGFTILTFPRGDF